MTKKHYIALADVMKESHRVGGDHHLTLPQARALALRLADIMTSDNPNFDEVRFLVACGVQDAAE